MNKLAGASVVRSDKPLFRRLRFSTRPIVPVTALQQQAISRFRAAIEAGHYSFVDNPCLCGNFEADILVGCRDRYGLAVRTVLCHGCGLMRTDPYLDPSSIIRFYETEYRTIYGGSAQATPEFFAGQVAQGERIISFLKQPGIDWPTRVLEVGCGAGGILHSFQQQKCIVAGCDYGHSYLELGRQYGLTLYDGGAATLTASAPADLVILSHVLEHFFDPISELKFVRSLLAPTGAIYVELPGLLWLENTHQMNLGQYLQNAHVYHFCLASLDYVMARAGFRRIAGTEQIMAVYRPAEITPVLPAGLANRVVSYLRQTDKLRREQLRMAFFRRAKASARSIVRTLRGASQP